jgi:hypothetical protein
MIFNTIYSGYPGVSDASSKGALVENVIPLKKVYDKMDIYSFIK